MIFVTAHEDDAYALRGYSLGAVDYMLSPVQPNILRAKVAVFIDLYRNAEEIRAQRQTLERYATQLRQLSEASLAIYSASDFDDVLAVVADNAARIIGSPTGERQRAHAAQRPRHHRRGRGAGNGRARPASCATHRSICRPSASIDRCGCAIGHNGDGPGRRISSTAAALQGWLGAPLMARDGRLLGVVQLSEKADGDFTPRTRIS
jgi:hypothetical protein